VKSTKWLSVQQFLLETLREKSRGGDQMERFQNPPRTFTSNFLI
jgi:hypothetical protein